MTQPALAHQRSLFLQALAAMQATPWQDKNSYFQLAGIHGLPYMAYDGAINPASPYVEGQRFAVDGVKRPRNGGECACCLLGCWLLSADCLGRAITRRLPTAPLYSIQGSALTLERISRRGTARSCCLLRASCASVQASWRCGTATAPTRPSGALRPTS